MRCLLTIGLLALAGLTLAGCGGEPASGPAEDRLLFEQPSNPSGDPEANPFRPGAPVFLDIPAGPGARSSPPPTNPAGAE